MDYKDLDQLDMRKYPNGILTFIGDTFCKEHEIKSGMFGEVRIVRYNDILDALNSDLRRDSSRYYIVNEIPAVIWAIQEGIFGSDDTVTEITVDETISIEE